MTLLRRHILKIQHVHIALDDRVLIMLPILHAVS